MTTASWIAIAAILVVPLLGIFGWSYALASRITALEIKIEVFWRDVSFDAARTLHSPDPKHARMDYLIDAYIDGRQTEEELMELVTRLREKIDDQIGERSERLTASLMLRSMAVRYPRLTRINAAPHA